MTLSKRSLLHSIELYVLIMAFTIFIAMLFTNFIQSSFLIYKETFIIIEQSFTFKKACFQFTTPSFYLVRTILLASFLKKYFLIHQRKKQLHLPWNTPALNVWIIEYFLLHQENNFFSKFFSETSINIRLLYAF